PRAEFNPFTHTWSLGVEEQFYLLAPLLLFVALGSRFKPRQQHLATLAIGLLAALSLAACFWWGWSRGSRSVFYPLVFRFWELAAGVLLFLAGSRIKALDAPWTRLYRASSGIGMFLVGLAMWLPRPEAYPWLRAAIAVAGTLMLIGLPNLAPGGRLRPVLSSRWAVWVGLRSYSLYLWHWPVYVLARWTTGLERWPFNMLAVLVSFMAAAMCFKAIENPLRHSPVLRRQLPSVRIGLMVALLTAGWLTSQALLEHQPRLGLGQPTREAADWYADRRLLKTVLASSRFCEPTLVRAAVGPFADGLTRFVPEGCITQAAHRLFVIGDSHATAYLPLLEQLSAEQGREVNVIQVPGCAWLDLMAPMTPDADARCHASAQAALHLVLAEGRQGDIVFLPSLRVPRLIELGGRRRVAGPDGDIYTRTPDEWASSARAAADALRWLTPLTGAGMSVILELPKPVFRAHPFASVDWFNQANPLCTGGLVERQSDQERLRAPIVAAVQSIAAANPGVRLWDPMTQLCDGEHCAALRGDRPLFFDGDHLSPYGNLLLLPSFREAVVSREVMLSRGDR
ncbi:MAG: acyltransferase, partial [Burkholderiaceae bacterium]|nr:acyltransferase [Burkholderiaceae bacterium]